MAKAFTDGLFGDEEYHRQKKLIEMEIESLVLPDADVAEAAGNLVKDLPCLWANANLAERRELLLTMLEAVYVDSKAKRIVALTSKPAFKPVFKVARILEELKPDMIKGSLSFLKRAPCVSGGDGGESKCI